jgi:CHAT domain-containing protein/Flp pilus assembly protein TadD
MNNLALLYYSQGRYSEAEPLFKQALQLSEKVLGKEHPDTLVSMNNLAGLYRSQGRYSEAEPLYKQALQLREKVLGREHPNTLTSMNNLAGLYRSQGRYSEAEPLFKQALQLSEKILGKEHPNTLISMNNLALLYKSQGRYSEAEPLYKQALQLSEKVLGREHPNTLNSMNNLALLYYSQGRYSEAEPLFKQALQLSEKVLGTEHPNTLTFQLNYVYSLVNEQRIQPAFRLLKQMEDRLLSRSFQELYGTYTERGRRLYLTTISNFQDVVFTLAQKYPTEEHSKFAANVVLRWKQVYADEAAFQHRFLYVSHDPDVERLRDTIKGLRAEVSWMVYHPADRDIQPIRDKLRSAEAELREKVKVYRSGLLVTSASIDQILGRMPEDSGLIEFRMYRPVDFKAGKYGNTHWAAYFLLSDIEAKQQVFFVDLGELEGTFSGAKAGHLYQRLLGNFDAQINGLKRLYIAPDGPLNLVSFSSLILPDGRYLVQRQEVNRLQTGRDFLRPAPEKSSNILVAVGGVDYDRPIVDKAAVENERAGDSIRTAAAYPNQRAGRELGRLNYLKCSLKEVARIALLYERNCKEGKAMVYQGDNATEDRLKTMKHAPRVLHLSTHGFYLSSEKMDEWAGEEPLALSGLALAGANQGLSGLVDRDTGDDGLLYSLEILSLDLQGTELVSLAACDTGKGVVDYSEGVYGLVRAFRTAGARSVLMTLHTVDDYEAKDFMIKFYEIWLSSKDNPSPAQALHRTRLYFINRTAKPEYKDPRMWSPYVMVGG